jgi:hypothetical protein
LCLLATRAEGINAAKIKKKLRGRNSGSDCASRSVDLLANASVCRRKGAGHTQQQLHKWLTPSAELYTTTNRMELLCERPNH